MAAQARTTTPSADEIAALRAEVARLEAELAAEHEAHRERVREREHGAVWRAIVAAVLIVVGVALTPATIAAAWAATELSNTDRFVASLAPLSHDPAVRNYVGTAIVGAVEKRVDIDKLTADAFSGIASLGLSPTASTALQSLSPAAAQGLKQLLADAVHKVVTSAQFQKVWDQTLRLSHAQLDDVLNNNQSAALVISDTGSVGINLAPIVAKVKTQLEAQNFPLATSIPAVHQTIAIGTVKEIVPIRNAYHLLLSLVAILPWLVVLLIAAGVVVANKSARTALWAGVGLAVVMIVTLSALAVGVQILASRASTRGVPPAVTTTLLNSLTAQMWGASSAVLIIGVVLAIAGFVAGASRPATSLRSAWARGITQLHSFLAEHRLWSPRLGSAFRAARYAVWVVAIGVTLLVLYLSEPLTPAAVLTATVIVAAVLVLFSLFVSPGSHPARDPGDTRPVG